MAHYKQIAAALFIGLSIGVAIPQTSYAAMSAVRVKTCGTITIISEPLNLPDQDSEKEEEEVEETEEETQDNKAYTDEDLTILAHVLAGECQSYPDEEQLYVGSVVLNRVTSSHYPNSIKEVVFQKHQYSCVSDGNYYREPTERNWANARQLLENGSVLPSYVIYQSGGRQGRGVYLKTPYHFYCFD
ncbi:MAG: cell wall hydrolase [Clostridiales bacterium]|nr:cell wall hydrolase [Clostridiales bacterium]